jgi:hypothetical protein
VLAQQRNELRAPVVRVLVLANGHVPAQVVGDIGESFCIDLLAEPCRVNQPMKTRKPEFRVVRVEEREEMTPRHGQHEQAARPEHPVYLAEQAPLVGDVLQHVEQ